jgi:hypothetical protein
MAEIYEHLSAPERFDTVMADAINSSRFLPSICELRERAGLISPAQEQAAGAEAAWDFVLRYVREWYGIPGR